MTTSAPRASTLAHGSEEPGSPWPSSLPNPVSWGRGGLPRSPSPSAVFNILIEGAPGRTGAPPDPRGGTGRCEPKLTARQGRDGSDRIGREDDPAELTAVRDDDVCLDRGDRPLCLQRAVPDRWPLSRPGYPPAGFGESMSGVAPGAADAGVFGAGPGTVPTM